RMKSENGTGREFPPGALPGPAKRLSLSWFRFHLSGFPLLDPNGKPHPVRSRGHDASRVARAFAQRVEPRRADGLEGPGIAGDAHGRGGARFGTDHQTLGDEAGDLAVELAEGIAQRRGDLAVEQFVEVRPAQRLLE